jgi:hypothetical protein
LSEPSPSGPGRTCRLPALPQARARLRPAGQRPLPPNCNKALISRLLSTRTADLVQNEYLALLGALGVLVGLALATTDQNAAR